MDTGTPVTYGPDRQAAGGEHPVRVLVSAASRHGSTAEIAAAIRDGLARQGLEAVAIPPAEVADVTAYDAVIIGSAVYMGHWEDAAKDLVMRCREGLAARPVWLFSSGPVGDPAGRFARSMNTDPVDLAQIRAAAGARDHRIFAGKLEAGNLSPVQRAALLIFRGMTGDFRDWGAIREWTDGIAAQLTGALHP